jgi:hypothetical protein
MGTIHDNAFEEIANPIPLEWPIVAVFISITCPCKFSSGAQNYLDELTLDSMKRIVVLSFELTETCRMRYSDDNSIESLPVPDSTISAILTTNFI